MLDLATRWDDPLGRLLLLFARRGRRHAHAWRMRSIHDSRGCGAAALSTHRRRTLRKLGCCLGPCSSRSAARCARCTCRFDSFHGRPWCLGLPRLGPDFSALTCLRLSSFKFRLGRPPSLFPRRLDRADGNGRRSEHLLLTVHAGKGRRPRLDVAHRAGGAGLARGEVPLESLTCRIGRRSSRRRRLGACDERIERQLA